MEQLNWNLNWLSQYKLKFVFLVAVATCQLLDGHMWQEVCTKQHRYGTPFYCQIVKILSCDRGLIYTFVSEIFEKYCIICITVIFQSLEKKKFAGSSVVKTGHFHCPGPGSIPGQGTKIPKAMWHWTKKKKKKPGKYYLLGFPGGSVLKKPGDSSSIPGSGWT